MSELAAVAPPASWSEVLKRGFRARPMTVLLIAALNTAMALLQWVDDPRPFWHPFVSVQISGFAIAYCVNAAQPWDSARPVWKTIVAVAIGSALAIPLIIVAKQYDLAYVTTRWRSFSGNFFAAFFMGMMFALFFLVRERNAMAKAAILRAEAERHRLAKQAVEAQLMVMQAQVEPHFLFNTLASVQYLVETDPREASRLLAHLIAYLRAALPQLRATSTTLDKEFVLAREYLSVLRIRIGERLAFDASLPDALATHPFPPNMLISLVENAVKHGIEPAAQGGRISLRAERVGDELRVEVVDTGRGLPADGKLGDGVGLSNVRERLAALHGSRGRFVLEPVTPHGTRAMIVVPYQPG